MSENQLYGSSLIDLDTPYRSIYLCAKSYHVTRRSIKVLTQFALYTLTSLPSLKGQYVEQISLTAAKTEVEKPKIFRLEYRTCPYIQNITKPFTSKTLFPLRRPKTCLAAPRAGKTSTAASSPAPMMSATPLRPTSTRSRFGVLTSP